MKIVHILLAMTLAVLVLGPFSGIALAQQHGSPRFPVNVTLGPVSPPPGASFTPKYPNEFKATPPPGLNATVSPKVTAKPTTKVKHKMSKPSVTPMPTKVKHKTFKPSASALPSVTGRPILAAALKPTKKASATPSATVKPTTLKRMKTFTPMSTITPSVKPVVPTVSIKPAVKKQTPVSPVASIRPTIMR